MIEETQPKERRLPHQSKTVSKRKQPVKLSFGHDSMGRKTALQDVTRKMTHSFGLHFPTCWLYQRKGSL